MQRTVKIRYALLAVVLLIIIALFNGPLFPFSPLKPGFKKIKYDNAILYISHPTALDSAVYHLDRIVREEETFHDLKYRKKFRIVIVNPKSSMKRFLPWMRGTGYSVSLSLANLIYIGPYARRSPAGIEPYLKHELSHLIIDQNTTFKKALKMHGQGWFVEGIAEYFSGHSFYTKAEFLEQCRKQNLDFLSLYEENPLKMDPDEIRLKYSFYRFFVGYLVEQYGLERLQTYLKNYLKDPDSYKTLFSSVYPNEVSEILTDFKASVTAGRGD